MRLAARSLKVTALLDADGLHEPGNASRVVLEIVVDSTAYTADIASKSVRKALATLREHGPDRTVLLIQGKLGAGNTIVEAGLVAQVKAKRED